MEQIKKVLIIGSKGMAGHVIYHHFKKANYEIIDVARDDVFFSPSYNLDVTNFNLLENVLKEAKPNIVINCIGILNRDAEDNPDKAILLNSYFPHFLAKIGSTIGFKLIHISTDCVFSGKQGNYEEESFKDGIGIYAQSKALGEILYGNNLTIRTSIIGPELRNDGIGLFHWFMSQKGTIKGYSEAYWTGVTTIELAKALHAAIDQNLTGLHHLVNNNKINKYDLISLFKNVFNKTDLVIEKYDKYQIDKSLIRTNDLFNYKVPTYQDMIIEMKDWITNYKQLYKNYIL